MKSKSNNQPQKSKAAAPKQDFWQMFDQFSRNKWVIGVMLIIVSFVFNHNYSSIYDRKVDLNGDNIYYYSLGQALSQGEGYTNIINLEKTPHTHFPPGYPWFISKIIKVFPDNIQTVKKTNGFLMYLSVIMFFFVILLTTRNSILSFCSAILMSLHKELLRFATIMMSETLFMFLSLLAILLALLLVKDIIGVKRKWVFWVAVAAYALIIAFTYLVRTMGLSLILAMVGWLGILAIASLIRWRKALKNTDETAVAFQKTHFLKTGLLCIVTLFAVGTAKFSWDARNKSLGVTGGDYESMFMRKTNNEKMEGMADWKARIESNTSHFITRWIPEATYMKPAVPSDKKITGKEWFMGLLLIAVMIAGCLYLNTGRLLMLFYVGLTVGVLILYPEQFGGLRYITPIMPFFIFLMLNGLSAVVAGVYKVAKLSHPPLLAQGILVLLLTLGVLAPKYTEAQTDFRKTARIKSWLSTADVNAVNFLNAAKFCGDSLPKDARIINRKPELFYMFSNYHPSNGFPLYAEPDTIYNMLCRDSINYLIVDSWFRHAYVTLYPCIQKYPEKFKQIKKFGDVDTLRKTNPTFIFEFNDKWGYHGEMKDGVRQGEGEMYMQDGRSYKGTFANNLPNGHGTLYDAQGKKLVSGIWKDGILVQPTQ
jgi:hypothetical protein